MKNLKPIIFIVKIIALTALFYVAKLYPFEKDNSHSTRVYYLVR